MIVYRLSQWFTRTVGRIFWGLSIEGRDTVPTEGPVIYAATHESFLDPVILGAVAPPVRYLARKSLFVRDDGSRRGFATWLGTIYGVVEIDRDAGGSEGLRKSVAELKAGHSLLLFPEGTRSNDGAIRKLQPGVGLIALRTGAKVVPVSVSGTRLVWPRGMNRPKLFGGPIRIIFGEATTYTRPTKAGDVAVDLHRRLLALRGQTEALEPA